MTTALTSRALRDVTALFRGDSAAGLPDDGLLRRFLDGLDAGDAEAADAAFSALVARHGPMVLGVCRRALGDANDIDDAFQAVFLVLVRRARSVRVEGSLGRWLYGVARKVAARARTESSRRRARHGSDPADRAEASRGDGPDRAEVRDAIDEELARLPERYRVPILLCGLDGLSYEEAAARLRWPVGTLKSRLSRGRDRLAARLARRGVGPSAPALVFVHPAVSPELAASALRHARGLLSGGPVPAPLLRLARPDRIGLGPVSRAAGVAALGVGCTGAVVLGLRDDGPGRRIEAPRPAPARAEAVAARPPDVNSLPPAAGCVWERKPEPITPGSTLGVGNGDGSVACHSYIDVPGHALRLVFSQAEKPGNSREFRPVIFDAAGNRYLPKGEGASRIGGVVSFSMTLYQLDATALPPESAAFVGIERVLPEFHRLAFVAARKEAAARGMAHLPPPRVGEPFAFELEGQDGRPIRSADLRGKVVLVDGWATWCTPCMEKMPKLKALRDAHRDDGFEVVGLCFSDRTASRAALDRLGADWPQVFVPADEETQRLWFEASEIASLPHILLIDRAGVLRAVCTPHEIEARVLELLREPSAR